jgi:DNA-binding NarL/FixJ family response regulator
VNGLKTDSFSGSDPKYPIKVSVVDDDDNDLRLIGHALEQTGEFVCAGMYGSAQKALAGIPTVRPHVVLMDIRMPGMDGKECARRLKTLLPELVVIFVTGLLDPTTLTEAVQAGGDDYLVKPVGAAQCLATIRFAVGRRRGSDARPKTGSARGLILLTGRERAVLCGLATGLLYKEIAESLHTTETMVHKLQHRIFSKLQVSNRSEAVAVFYRMERSD